MTASRRHSLKPVVVEVRPDNAPGIIAPSTPPTPTAKKVSFAPSGDKVSRPLTSTEAWSLYHFENHARQCAQCFNPLDVSRRGDRLCDSGHWLAEDVACHVYHKNGDVYSIRKDDSKLVRVEIPHGYSQLHGLLQAMDRTLRSHRTLPALSHDRTYPISSRKTSTYAPDATPETVIIEPATSASRQSRHRTTRYSTVGLDHDDHDDKDEDVYAVKAPQSPLPSRRGTLYEKDMQRKEKNYRVEIRAPSDDRKDHHRRRRRDDVVAGDERRRPAGVYYYD